MKWIKASERLPNERKVYFVKVIHKNDDPRNTDCILKDTWLMENGKLVDTGFNQNDISWYKLVEWLDESLPSTGEDVQTPSASVGMEEAYWRERCLAAELFIKESPCDPDITKEQIEAYSKWQSLTASTPPAKDNNQTK